MKNRYQYILFLISAIAVTFAVKTAYAEESSGIEVPAAPSMIEAPLLTPTPPKISEAILEVLKPEEWFRTFQQYIKVPFPGTEIKKVEVNQEKISELNFEIGKETGVDIMRFFQFIGKVLVIILEGVARIIRGLLSGG